MAKKKASASDKLKQKITKEFGGAAADWKRVAKTKNDAGQVVREFKNTKTGLTVTAAGQGGAETDLRVSALEFGLLKDEDGVYAVIYPAGSKEIFEDSRLAADTVEKIFPAATCVDTCVGAYFQFPKEFDTAEKIVKLLESKGLVFQRKGSDRELIAEMDRVKAPTGATFIETDPAKIAAADKAMATILGENQDFDACDALVAEAGKALANRYYFAIDEMTGDDPVRAWIFPARVVDADLGWDQSPPSQLLPGWGEAQECLFEMHSPAVTPLEAARQLQGMGFIWSRRLQDSTNAALTETLSVLENPAAKISKPQGPKA